MGAAAAAPLAALMPPVGAVGCLWMGVTGGAFPDYVDLRSGMKRHLKHRGFSHSYLMLALSTAFVYVVLRALNQQEISRRPAGSAGTTSGPGARPSPSA